MLAGNSDVDDEGSLTIDSNIDFTFSEDFDKLIDDTTEMELPDFDGDVALDFALNYSKTKYNYSLNTALSFGGGFSDKIWTRSSDEVNVNNSFSYNLGDLSLTTSMSLASQLLNNIEDSLLTSSFLSPGNVSWSLGLQYSFDKWLVGSFEFNFASVDFIVFVNQSIYDILEVESLNEVERGKYFYTLVGVDLSYSLRKKLGKNLSISNSGKLFFPGQGKMMSEEWLKYFKVQLTNEISYSIDAVRLSLQTRLSYNNYLERSLNLYNKLAIGLTLF